MELRLQKWGNSYGIRIPSSIIKSLDLNLNDLMDIKEEDDRIIISKSKKQKISLEKLFEQYNGSNLAKDFSWDEPQGREIW
ncbi:MAG: AbrB/MazE/SpoVT family DNA-binding domain-containing protein [Bacilli bacterium]|nr:AbrB/MazE/SpoVT family DNA-binding domain-containing protein [Bacilli bacterium]